MKTYNDYFQSYNHYFWQWEEHGEIIAIPKGNTIAYRKLVLDLINRTADQGLPPFGSLLLAIIATNPGGSTSLDVVNEILKNTLKNESNSVLADAISFLKLLSEVPAPYTTGRKRVLLLIALFQNCHNMLSIKESIEIRDRFRVTIYDRADQLEIKKDFSHSAFSRDFRTLGLLSSRFQNVNDILKKFAALPDIPEEEIQLEENNIEPIESTDLIDQLENSYKTFHVGSLIKRIWSGLNIPVHSSLPSQQPIGGISDLTNKGDFDKLLISEYANEDIVFLSRLANNEALYIHREIPPTTNNLQRVILIDVSLRNWGTPKTLAYATMLAIAKHPKTNIECTAFAVGKTFYPISFDNVHSVIDALQILEGSLDAAQGIDAFFKEYPENKNREIFIITEPTTLKQVPMLKAMNNYHNNIHYWIYTDDEGNIDIYKKQQNSKKHIQHMQLPLDEIWSKQKTKQPPRKERKNNSIDFPILFRTSLNARKTLNTADGEIFQITNNKTLMRQYDKSAKAHQKGWEIIRDDLPFFHGEFEMGLLSNGEHVLLMFNPHDRSLILLNIDTNEEIKVNFPQWKSSSYPPSFHFHQDRFYHLYFRGAYSIGINGEIVEDAGYTGAIREQREKELNELTRNYTSHASIFKNIHTVFINETNNLVFNTHELYMNQGYHIKLDSKGFQAKKIEATKSEYNHQNEFIFKDGSTIEVDRNGVLILKSSNTSIPTIYVPSIIDFSLGVATETEFAGNLFFYKEPLYSVKLLNPGSQPIKTIQTIKEFTNSGLKESKELADAWPSYILENATASRCNQLISTLKHNGASAEMNRSAQWHKLGGEIEHITPKVFYKKYIESFIQTIISNAT